MKKIFTTAALCMGVAALAQTYPKYNNPGGGSTTPQTPKTEAPAPKPQEPKVQLAAPEPAIVKKQSTEKMEFVAIEANKTGNFQELMEKAVVQSKEGRFKKAIDFYTQALNISTPEQAWRALVSRATTYVLMKQPEKAMKDYTTVIESQNIPVNKLAYIYSCRARLAQDNNDMAMACADMQKAKDLGLSDKLTSGVACN